MTTMQTFIEGKCGVRHIRVKQWSRGFSIKCTKKNKTIVCRPYVEEIYLDDLKRFCVGCEFEERE